MSGLGHLWRGCAAGGSQGASALRSCRQQGPVAEAIDGGLDRWSPGRHNLERFVQGLDSDSSSAASQEPLTPLGPRKTVRFAEHLLASESSASTLESSEIDGYVNYGDSYYGSGNPHSQAMLEPVGSPDSLDSTIGQLEAGSSSDSSVGSLLQSQPLIGDDSYSLDDFEFDTTVTNNAHADGSAPAPRPPFIEAAPAPRPPFTESAPPPRAPFTFNTPSSPAPTAVIGGNRDLVDVDVGKVVHSVVRKVLGNDGQLTQLRAQLQRSGEVSKQPVKRLQEGPPIRPERADRIDQSTQVDVSGRRGLEQGGWWGSMQFGGTTPGKPATTWSAKPLKAAGKAKKPKQPPPARRSVSPPAWPQRLPQPAKRSFLKQYQRQVSIKNRQDLFACC